MKDTITEIVPNGIMPERFNTVTEIKIKGGSRMGMSIYVHRMQDILYQKYGYKVCWLNDRLNEFNK